MSVKIKKEKQTLEKGKYRVINYRKDDFMVIGGVKGGKHLTEKDQKVVHNFLGEKMIKAKKAVEVKGVELEEFRNPFRNTTLIPKQK